MQRKRSYEDEDYLNMNIKNIENGYYYYSNKNETMRSVMTLIRKMKGNDAAARGKVLWLYNEIVPTLGRLLAKISENEYELDSNSEGCN